METTIYHTPDTLEPTEVKFPVHVLVPKELQPLVEGDLLFIAAREEGRLVIRPMVDYSLGKSCDDQESRYRLGFVDGVLKGYDDGYRKGFYTAYRQLHYDPVYRAGSWTEPEDDLDE